MRDEARQRHDGSCDEVHVVLGVFEADGSPRIGDRVLDPFAVHRRGEARLAARDRWVSDAQRQPVVEGEP
jgi:hypothetical protein